MVLVLLVEFQMVMAGVSGHRQQTIAVVSIVGRAALGQDGPGPVNLPSCYECWVVMVGGL